MQKRVKSTRVAKKTNNSDKKTPKKLSNLTSPVTSFVSRNQLFLTVTLIFLGLFAAIAGGLLWYYKVFADPERVFWAMVNNNLATSSVTKVVTEQTEQSQATDSTRFYFTLPTAVAVNRSLVQLDESGQTVIKLKDIGTEENDYRSFVYIERNGPDGQPLDYSALYGQWVNSNRPGSDTPAQDPNLLSQSLIGAIIFGNMQPSSRNQLLDTIRDKNVYKVNFDDAARTNLNGDSAYVFSVDVNPEALGVALQTYGRLTGDQALADINLQSFSGPPFTIELVVDIRSRQIRSVAYGGAGYKEDYSAYGLSGNIDLPTESLDVEAFNKLLSEVEQN